MSCMTVLAKKMSCITTEGEKRPKHENTPSGCWDRKKQKKQNCPVQKRRPAFAPFDRMDWENSPILLSNNNKGF